MFSAILGALVSIIFLRTEGTVVLWSLFSMCSLIRSLVKFFPKDLALPRTGRDISGEQAKEAFQKKSLIGFHVFILDMYKWIFVTGYFPSLVHDAALGEYESLLFVPL